MDASIYLFVWFFVFAICIAITRWAFRINDIVRNLEEIKELLRVWHN